jgi:hypothetical protein
MKKRAGGFLTRPDCFEKRALRPGHDSVTEPANATVVKSLTPPC